MKWTIYDGPYTESVIRKCTKSDWYAVMVYLQSTLPQYYGDPPPAPLPANWLELIVDEEDVDE